MNVVGLEKLSLVDYDHYLSAVLFTNGCNFRCPFCHNSELVLNKGQIIPNEIIFNFLKERKGLLDAVVISGGEPTLNSDLYEYIEHSYLLILWLAH